MSLPDGAVPDGLDLAALTHRLTSVAGVVGVVLGGSRARGEHTPDSDVDLGLYYQGDLDTAALGAMARDVAGPDAEVTQSGEWGPWVDGGGWLVVDGVHVDWIYRDVDRVREAWARAHRGAYDCSAYDCSAAHRSADDCGSHHGRADDGPRGAGDPPHA